MTARVVLPVAAAGVAALALALRIETGPLPEVTHFRDDAYYYFTWVRSVVSGAGPVVSEGVATNGVHLLWALLLLPFGLAGAATVPAAAQVLGLLLHGATAAVIAGRGGPAGAVVGLLYLGHPLLIAEAQNGQETALACFTLAVLWRCRRVRWPWFLAAAVAVTLARSDLWPCVLALSLWRCPSGRGLGVPLGAFAVLLVASRAVGGSWVQDSAWPMAWLEHARFLATDPDAGERAARWWWWARPVLLGWPWALVQPVGIAVAMVLAVPWLRRCGRWLPLVLVGGAAAAGADGLGVPLLVALGSMAAPLDGRWPRSGDLLALLLGVAALVVLHLVVRQHPRDYYFAPLGVVGAVALRRLGPRGAWVFALVLLHQGWLLSRPPPRRPWQEEMAMAGRLVDAIVPPASPVGCFNAGLVTWHRGGGVVNLDGVVDRRAFAALREGRLGAWLDRRGVAWIVDNPVQVSRDPTLPHACGIWFGADFDPGRDLLEVVRFERPGDAGRPGTEALVLYLRRGRAAAPRLPAFGDLGPAPGGGRYVLWWGAEGDVLERLRADGAVEPVATGRGRVQVLRVDGGDGDVLRDGTGPLLRFPS